MEEPAPPEPPKIFQIKLKGTKMLIFHGYIQGALASILIDSGAGPQFLDTDFARVHRLSAIQKTSSDQVIMGDGHTSPSSSFIPKASVQMDGYKDRINFHITNLGGFDAILGKEWLERINPTIDWRNNIVRFSHGGKQHVLKSPGRLANHPELAELIITSAQIRRAAKESETLFFAASIKNLDPATGARQTLGYEYRF